MIVRRILMGRDDLQLTEVQFIGVSGQVCSTTYELNGPELQVFTIRAGAEEAFLRSAHGPAHAAWAGS